MLFTPWVLHVPYRVTLVAVNCKHNGMDTFKKKIRCSAEEWKNRSLSIL